MAIVIGNQYAEPFRKKDTISSQRMLAGRINDLVITTVTGLGTRASFRIERAGQCPVFCCVDGNIARELIAHYCDGDLVSVSGLTNRDPPPPRRIRHGPADFGCALCGLPSTSASQPGARPGS